MFSYRNPDICKYAELLKFDAQDLVYKKEVLGSFEDFFWVIFPKCWTSDLTLLANWKCWHDFIVISWSFSKFYVVLGWFKWYFGVAKVTKVIKLIIIIIIFGFIKSLFWPKYWGLKLNFSYRLRRSKFNILNICSNLIPIFIQSKSDVTIVWVIFRKI